MGAIALDGALIGRKMVGLNIRLTTTQRLSARLCVNTSTGPRNRLTNLTVTTAHRKLDFCSKKELEEKRAKSGAVSKTVFTVL